MGHKCHSPAFCGGGIDASIGKPGARLPNGRWYCTRAIDAGVVDATPYVNARGALCFLCDGTDEHSHPNSLCLRCGEEGLSENLKRHVCVGPKWKVRPMTSAQPTDGPTKPETGGAR